VVGPSGGTSLSAVLGATAGDSEAYLTGSLSSFSSANFGAVLRWADGNNWYKAFLDGANLVIQRKVAGATTVLAMSPFPATAGTFYNVHFRVVGSTLSANAWASSGSEPGGWMVSTTDGSFASGHAGLRLLTQSGTATITSFSADVPGSGPPPTTTTTTSTTSSTTSTSTTSTSTTSSTTSTTAPTTTTSSTSTTSTTVQGGGLATDTFVRANQAHWGNASDGQTWGGDANTVAVFSISADKGVVSRSNGATYSAVLGPVAADAEATVTGSLSSFSNANFGPVLRWTDGNNWYKAYLDGTSLIIQKKVAGATTVLASIPFAATAGTAYSIHFRASGSTLTANVWVASGSEPGGWMVTVADGSLTSGHAGIRVLTQSGTATFTAFSALSP